MLIYSFVVDLKRENALGVGQGQPSDESRRSIEECILFKSADRAFKLLKNHTHTRL